MIIKYKVSKTTNLIELIELPQTAYAHSAKEIKLYHLIEEFLHFRRTFAAKVNSQNKLYLDLCVHDSQHQIFSTEKTSHLL